MSNLDAALNRENEIISELMAEGFGDHLLPRRDPELPNRVTIASQVTVATVPCNEVDGEVLEGVPCQVEAPESPTTDFTLSRCQLNDYTATLCIETFRIDRNLFRVFTTPFADRLSYHHISIPIAHFQAKLHLPLDPAFVDFLVFTKVQSGQIHSNVVRTIMSLVFFCHRLNCEMTMKIVWMFFFLSLDD